VHRPGASGKQQTFQEQGSEVAASVEDGEHDHPVGVDSVEDAPRALDKLSILIDIHGPQLGASSNEQARSSIRSSTDRAFSTLSAAM
jgi:hypothetical protein